MPELPEVETLRRSLLPRLPGRKLGAVTISQPALREPVDTRRFPREAPGRRILGLRRRAKYLLLDCEGERTLVVHLGMSGQLTLVPATAPPRDHEHLRIALDGGEHLAYRDPRRFGLVLWLPTATLAADRHFAHLGREPLEDGFDGAALRAAALRRRGPVKAFLMDARVVVGVGNIYASEALFAAGIHPFRSVARIAAPRWERLARSVRSTLEHALELGGTTLSDYRDGSGEPGSFQSALAVYGREGAPCPRCEAPVRRATRTGRSTYYCPVCQR